MSANEAVWTRLAAADLVSGAAPAVAPPAPWYVTAMVGTAAWLSALFLLFFLGLMLASPLRNAGSALVIGAVVCAVAIAVLRWVEAGVFLRQLAVATSLAGQGLVVFGILDRDVQSAPAWLGVALFEAALVAAAPEPVHRTLTTLAAAFALRMALLAGGAGWLYPPLLVAALAAVFAASDRLPAGDALWAPILVGLGLAALAVVPMSAIDDLLWYGRRATASALLPWRTWGAALLAIAWLAAVAVLARAAAVPRRSRAMAMIALAAIAIAATAWPVPNVVVALVLLLVAFAGGRTALAGLAVLALLGALGHAYYSLQWSLLAKSGALAATGAVLLAAGIALRTLGGPEERHA